MTEQPKETQMPHDIPDWHWQKLGIDLFESETIEYLITVIFFSNFWKIDRLEDTSTSIIICKLKAHFVRYGTPCQLISNVGLQFTSSLHGEMELRTPHGKPRKSAS